MDSCRSCKGGHRHRDCHSLKTGDPKPAIPPRAGTARGAPDGDNTLDFLMGVVATDEPSCSTRPSGFVSFMAMLTALFWFITAYIF